jgi:hypothetical protein
LDVGIELLQTLAPIEEWANSSAHHKGRRIKRFIQALHELDASLGAKDPR